MKRGFPLAKEEHEFIDRILPLFTHFRSNNYPEPSVDFVIEDYPPRPNPLYFIHREYDIRKRDLPQGFVDIFVTFEDEIPLLKCEINKGKVRFFWGKEIKRKNQDAELSDENPTTIREVCIEIKTYIHSVGEILRDISFYRGYFEDPIMVVIAPKQSHLPRLLETLQDERITFIEYPEKVELNSKKGPLDSFVSKKS